MTVSELEQKYYFHDSLLDKISIDRQTSTVFVFIDFCYWAQKDYNNHSSETGEICLTFSGVKEYPNLEGELSAFSILDTQCEDNNTWKVAALDDDTDTYYEFQIEATDVQFKSL